MKKLVLLLVAFLCFGLLIKAQTQISAGTVSGKWIKTNSPYIINGDVVVSSGTTLSIESGVKVLFNGAYKFTVNGKLLAQGKVNDSIIFSRLNATDASRGRGIRIEGSADTSLLAYCVVEYMYSPEQFGGGVYSSGTMILRNSALRNNVVDGCGGGVAINTTRYNLIERCLITSNKSTGVHNYNATGGAGIYMYGNATTVVNSIIVNNRDEGVNKANYEGGGGIEVYCSSPQILNNIIYKNYSAKGSGIHLVSAVSSPKILNNIIWDNFGSANSEQISIEPEYSPSPYNPSLVISYNDINANGIVVLARNSLSGYTYTQGVGNISSNPAFVNVNANDYHLPVGSACVDAGIPNVTGLNLPQSDFYGNYRLRNNRIDIGVQECVVYAISLSPQTPSPNVGQVFEMLIKTETLLETENIIAYQFNINYDKTKLQYQSASLLGTWAEGGSIQINSTTAGKLSVALARPTPIFGTGTGSIFKLNFMPIAKGMTTPILDAAYFNAISIISMSNPITINLKYGDVDVNGITQAYDAALTLQASVGLGTVIPLPWDSWRKTIADVDGDVSITANDAALILKYVSGLITKFPVEGAKKGGSTGSVNLAIENNEIVFRSSGDLCGLNVFADEGINLLGNPIIVDQTMMSATNVDGNTYAVGLATATAPAENSAVLKIPYKSKGVVTFNLISNTNSTTAILNLTTGVVELSENSYFLFPNPAHNELNISGLKGISKLLIYDINGKLILSKSTSASTETIHIAHWASGVYTISINGQISKFVKE